MNDMEDENEDNEEKEEEEEEIQFQETGVFYPDLDQILWRREVKVQESIYYQYLVKYKDYSYLHLEWISEEEIINDSKGGKNKLNRFNKMFDKKIREGVIYHVYKEFRIMTQKRSNKKNSLIPPSLRSIEYCIRPSYSR
jgi:hypothetical protein